MNQGDRSDLESAKTFMEEARTILEAIRDSLEERIENIEETFPDGNPTSQRLEEERDELDASISDLENAEACLEGLV